MTLYLPNLSAPLVDKDGRVVPPWNSFFQQFTQAPSGVMSVLVGASPFRYTAKEPGNMIVTGGTISDMSFTRGGETFQLNIVTNIIPLAIADELTITYSVAPSMRFLPR